MLLETKTRAPSCRILRTAGSSGSAERLDREREQKDRVAAARRGMGSRIPSWLHLTALGDLAVEGCSYVAAGRACVRELHAYNSTHSIASMAPYLAAGLPSVPSEENLTNLRDGRYVSTDDLPAMPRSQSSSEDPCLLSSLGACSKLIWVAGLVRRSPQSCSMPCRLREPAAAPILGRSCALWGPPVCLPPLETASCSKWSIAP